MSYSPARREAVLKKMMPPNNQTIAEIAQAEGISAATLYNWRSEARKAGRLLPNTDQNVPDWSSKDKFAAVLETAALSEAEIAQSCRQRGLYPEQLSQWRAACEQANDWQRSSERELKATTRANRQDIKRLQSELTRKDKALAEAAALLVLKKKYQAMFEDNEDV